MDDALMGILWRELKIAWKSGSDLPDEEFDKNFSEYSMALIEEGAAVKFNPAFRNGELYAVEIGKKKKKQPPVYKTGF